MSRAGQVKWRIALPWLEPAADRDTVPERRLPAAEWLVARGEAPRAVQQSWREWLAGDLLAPRGGLAAHAAGPCLRALDDARGEHVTWAALRPVHLLTAIDHLQVADRPLDLDANESAAIATDLSRHFAGDGLPFHVGRRRDWLVGLDRELRCETVAPDALPGRNLRDLMPRGEHASAVAAFINEVQMLLHEHPVNVARAARGVATVNALWPWGYGRSAAHAPLALPVLCTDDDWLDGAWRLHGVDAQRIASLGALIEGGAHDVLVGWSDVVDAVEVERLCFEPLVEALGRVDVAVELLIGQRECRIDGRARHRFWRRRRPLSEALA